MESYEDTVIHPEGVARGGAWPRAVGRLFLFILVTLAGIALGSPAWAETSDNGTTPAETSRPKVDLGRLLKLPDSYSHPVESRRGLGQAQWQSRFESVRLDLKAARTALQKAQSELGEAATDSSQWAVAAPGTAPNPENTPLSYKLRQEIRRQREAVERAERKLRALEIEADLADVPQEWRANEIESGPAETSATAEAGEAH